MSNEKIDFNTYRIFWSEYDINFILSSEVNNVYMYFMSG